ncbi:hypothetical protein GCM10023314_13130 [Algibacter agarivorans]|uniref:Transmembrane protein n=1 Tax=Algibacter agarivorans TaxID=1109741 RepID=A0ABP9GP38_9FLAO
MPSFSIKYILNQLNTSTLSCNMKLVLIYILLIWSMSKMIMIKTIDFFNDIKEIAIYDFKITIEKRFVSNKKTSQYF